MGDISGVLNSFPGHVRKRDNASSHTDDGVHFALAVEGSTHRIIEISWCSSIHLRGVVHT